MTAFDQYLRTRSKGHLIGVGGVSMSPLAEVLAGAGMPITGSDMAHSEKTAHLEQLGCVHAACIHRHAHAHEAHHCAAFIGCSCLHSLCLAESNSCAESTGILTIELCFVDLLDSLTGLIVRCNGSDSNCLYNDTSLLEPFVIEAILHVSTELTLL